MTTTADTPMTVRVYAADGATLLCEFPYFVSLSILDVYNNVGSHTFQWNLNSSNASTLISDSDLQLAVMMDRRDGNGFQEIWRGFYEQDNYDPSMNESAVVSATGRSIVAILNQAIVYPQGGVGNTTTSWSFSGASPGKIMHDLLVAAQARGCFPLLTWDFTSGQDSSGAAWAHGFTNAFAAGTNMFDLLISMSQGGLCDFSMTGFTLHLYNPKTTLAVDHSSSVFIRRSREVVTSPQARDRTQIATVMLAQGDNGLNVERTASTYGSLGRFESYLSQSGVTDAPTLDFWADQALGAIDDQLISETPTYVIDTSKGTPIPWKDYFSGNYISLDTPGNVIKYQVAQIAAQCGPGGPTFVQPTLNDVFYSREVLVAAQLGRLGGTAISGPAVLATPAPGPNPTVPGTPAFVPANIFTAAYFSPSTGTILSQLELNWTTPANTDSTTMIDGFQYIIQYRISTTPIYPIPWSQLQGKPWNTIQGNPWSNPLATPQNTQWTTVLVGIDNNNAIIGGLICGETYEFQIACTDVSGNTGAFSAVSNFVTATDNVAPLQPDAPVVSASMVAVQVMSDLGLETGGSYNLANDLDHLEVHYSYDPAFVPQPGVGSATYLGKLIANAGMMAAKIEAVGTFQVTNTTGVYIRLIAVDSSGNTSPPSPSSGVTAVLIDDSHISSMNVSKLLAGTILATIILGGTIATSNVGQRAVMDMAGFHAYNANGYKIFDVSPANTTITLASGVNGISFTVDCSGAYPTLLLYDVTGTGPAVINAVEFGSQTGAGIGVNTAAYTSFYDGSSVSQRLYMSGPGSIQLAVIKTTPSNPEHGGALLVGDLGLSMDMVTNGVNDGGHIQLTRTSSQFGLFPNGITHGGQILFTYNSGASDSSVEVDGYTSNAGSVAPGPQFAYFWGATGFISSGVGSIALGFGTTLYSTPVIVPVYACTSTTTIPGYTMNAAGVTGFTFTLSAAAPNNWTIQYSVSRYR
jgi:hypothetical protein